MGVFALVLLQVSLSSQRAQSELTLLQSKLGDQQSYYEAKTAWRDQIEVFQGLVRIDKKREQMAHNIERYRAEASEIQEKIQELARESAALKDKIRWMSFAEPLLEIAIVACAIAILTGRAAYWRVALLSACAGTILGLLAF